LCGHGLHPDELKPRLNGKQIADWLAFDKVEPFGPAAIERLAAIVAHTVELNMRKSPRRLTEFMPSEHGRVMTDEEIAAAFAGFGNGSGG
jgi:hypothetical protein